MDNGYIIGHLDGNHGGLYPKNNEFVAEGVPYIGANAIKNSRICFSEIKYLTKERALKFKKGVAKNNDVLFAHNATVGPVALLNTDLDFVILSTTLTYYRCDEDKVKPKYLLYYMQTDIFANQYRRIMGQTTRNQVPITMQREFRHIIPPIKEQEKIASILSTVDEQIDNVDALIEKNKELKKGLMQTLLTKGIGHTKFKKTEIGEIPEEWEVKKLGDIFKLSSGNFLSQKNIVEGCYPVYGGNGVNGYHNEYMFRESKLVIGRVGAKCGCVCLSEAKAWITDNALYISEKVKEFDDKYMYYLLDSINLNSYANQNAQPVISGQKIYGIYVAFPNINEQIKITKILSQIDEKIEEHENKKKKLEKLKKGLMQQLLSGQIRINMD